MGFFNWVKRRPSSVVNYGKKMIAADQLKEGGQSIVDMAKSLNKNSGRQETFENAYHRLGMTEEKLKEAYKFYAVRFYMFVGFSVLAFAFMFYYLFTTPLFSIGILGFLAICLSQIFHSSFRMMQMRHRQLLPPSYWFSNTDEWWIRPLPVKKKKRKLRKIKKSSSSSSVSKIKN